MKRFVILALVTLAAMAVGVGQDKNQKKLDATTRTVQGTVYDPQDNPVTGAVVQLKDLRTLQVRSYISRENGEYHFSSLKLDTDYEVEARNNDMTSGAKKISIFDNRKIVIQNLKTDKAEKK